MPLGLIIEGLVAVLLLLTIGFCIALNRKLVTLRADQTALQHTVAELDAATLRAERAIQGLRAAAGDANSSLTQQMRHADKMAKDLSKQVEAGGEVVSKLSAITRAAQRPAAPAKPEVVEGGNIARFRKGAAA